MGNWLSLEFLDSAKQLLINSLKIIKTKPLLLDAATLNIIANLDNIQLTQQCVITPHPTEAARLLSTDTAAVQQNRPKAAQDLAQNIIAL